MSQTFDEFWKYLLDNHRPYCYNPKKSAQMAWKAALDTMEAANTPTNTAMVQLLRQLVAYVDSQCSDPITEEWYIYKDTVAVLAQLHHS